MIIVPGKIKGKARPRIGKGYAYTPKDTVTYENWIKHCYIEQSNKLLEGSVKAEVRIYHEVPKSYSKKRISMIKDGFDKPNKKPDIDNILKIIFDSLNGIAYKDDSQIIEIHVDKQWTFEKERIEFKLTEQNEEEINPIMNEMS